MAAEQICHPHNLNRHAGESRPYGIRVTLPPEDTFALVLGTDWSLEHWYPTREARDRALEDMRQRHAYSRQGDLPTAHFEKIER